MAQIEVTASPCSIKALLYPYAVRVKESSEGEAANDFRTHTLAIRSTCYEVPSLPQCSAMMEVRVDVPDVPDVPDVLDAVWRRRLTMASNGIEWHRMARNNRTSCAPRATERPRCASNAR